MKFVCVGWLKLWVIRRDCGCKLVFWGESDVVFLKVMDEVRVDFGGFSCKVCYSGYSFGRCLFGSYCGWI